MPSQRRGEVSRLRRGADRAGDHAALSHLCIRVSGKVLPRQINPERWRPVGAADIRRGDMPHLPRSAATRNLHRTPRRRRHDDRRAALRAGLLCRRSLGPGHPLRAVAEPLSENPGAARRTRRLSRRPSRPGSCRTLDLAGARVGVGRERRHRREHHATAPAVDVDEALTGDGGADQGLSAALD